MELSLAKFESFSVEHRIGGGVVVHLHLSIHLHVLASSLDVLKQLVDGKSEVLLLFEQHVELGGTTCAMLLVGILALHLFAHVVYLQRKN